MVCQVGEGEGFPLEIINGVLNLKSLFLIYCGLCGGESWVGGWWDGGGFVVWVVVWVVTKVVVWGVVWVVVLAVFVMEEFPLK